MFDLNTHFRVIENNSIHYIRLPIATSAKNVSRPLDDSFVANKPIWRLIYVLFIYPVTQA